MQNYQKIREVADRAARKICRKHQIDTMGRDSDDYRQLFTIQIWKADQKLKSNCDPVERAKWRTTVVRNLRVSFFRQLQRQPELLRYNSLDDQRLDNSLETKVDYQIIIKRLLATLDPTERQILMQVATMGLLSRVWRSRNHPCSYRHFCRIFNDIQQKCRNFLLTEYPEIVLEFSGER